ncbi:hypothetical protein [Morganella morganii]|uniref:hypothetical protein n=1 Tax=Morganella morganii TaxID=582 RepID=UPI0034D419EF
MHRVKAGENTYHIPDHFTHNGESVEINPHDITTVYHPESFPEDDPIGVEISLDISGQGTVIIGITSDISGEVYVHDGPINEPDHYEHSDDRPYDTRFMPPRSFIDKIKVV